MSQPSDSREAAGRDAGGRFAAGNVYGAATAFKPGQCGNRLGRPPKVATYLAAIRRDGYTEASLRRIIADAASRPTQREAARRLLVSIVMHNPPAPIDPTRAYKYHRRFYRKGKDQLEAILIHDQEHADRRHAAWSRLRRW